MTSQVIIVGAGPTGLLLGIELARRGIAFRLIDRNSAPLGWDRATVIKPRSLEIFDQLRLADIFLERGQVINAVNLFMDGEQVASITFGDLDSRFAHMMSMPESHTEEILTAELERHGGQVERGLEMVGFDQSTDSVSVRLRDREGGESVHETAWLVGTDGLHSAVRAGLDDPFEGHDNSHLWAVVDGHLHGWRHPGDAITAMIQPPGTNPIPLKDGRWRIYFRPEVADASALEAVRRGLDSMSPGATLVNHDEPRFFRTHSRVAHRFRVGRALLAGDAAHACSPIQGHGMNSGIQDAFNLGWKLALVVDGSAPTSLLDSYGAERQPIDRMMVKSSDEAEAGFVRQDPEAQRHLIAELSGDSGVMRAALGEAEIAHCYDDSPIVGQSEASVGMSATLPGERVGEAAVIHAGGSGRLLDLLRGTGFLLLAMPGENGSADEADRLIETAVERFSPHLLGFTVAQSGSASADTLLDPAGDLRRRLGGPRPSLALIRPDGHLGFCAAPPSLTALEAHLAGCLRS